MTVFETVLALFALPWVIANQTEYSVGEVYSWACETTGGVYGPPSAAYIKRHGNANVACSYLPADKG